MTTAATASTAPTTQPQHVGSTGVSPAAAAESVEDKESGGASKLLEALRSLRLRLRLKGRQPERDVEVMKLKDCGHWFHAQCLASWFLIDRYDCPVCRKIYFEGKPRSRVSSWLQTNYNITMGAGVMV